MIYSDQIYIEKKKSNFLLIYHERVIILNVILDLMDELLLFNFVIIVIIIIIIIMPQISATTIFCYSLNYPLSPFKQGYNNNVIFNISPNTKLNSLVQCTHIKSDFHRVWNIKFLGFHLTFLTFNSLKYQSSNATKIIHLDNNNFLPVLVQISEVLL